MHGQKIHTRTIVFRNTLAIDEKERERARERAFGLVKVTGDHVNHGGEMLGNADYRWMRFKTPYIHRRTVGFCVCGR